jgi:transcriptional regulator with XRE-family HTH domain
VKHDTSRYVTCQGSRLLLFAARCGTLRHVTPPAPPATLGDYLFKLRYEAGISDGGDAEISQEEAAARVSKVAGKTLSRTHWNKWERGALKSLSPKYARRIEVAFGRPAGEAEQFVTARGPDGATVAQLDERVRRLEAQLAELLGTRLGSASDQAGDA